MKKLLQTQRVNDAQLVFVTEHSQQLRESWGILYFFFFALLPSPKKSLKGFNFDLCVLPTSIQHRVPEVQQTQAKISTLKQMLWNVFLWIGMTTCRL